MRKIALPLLLLFSMPAFCQTDVELDEAIVTGSRELSQATDDVPLSISTVSRDELTATFRSSALPTLTERVPGLFTTSRGVLGYGVNMGAGSLKVRGIGGMASLLVLIDGQPQYAGLMGHPIPDAYQTLLAERIDVVRGPASLLYGSNALGGVVNIVTRNVRQDGLRGNLSLQGGSYGTMETAANVQLRKGRWQATAGYNLGRTDGHRPSSAFLQHSGFLKAGYRINENWRTEADANITFFKAQNPGQVSAPLIDGRQKILRGVASLSLLNHYRKADGALRLYYNWGHHHINDGYNTGGKPRDVRYIHDDLVCGASLFETLRFYRGNHTTFGIDYKHFGGEAYNRDIHTGEHIALTGTNGTEFTEDEVAGYVDFRQELLSWLTLEAGLRYDYHSVAGGEWVPQGGLAFRLTADATLRAVVSKGFRNPTIREMYMFPAKNDELQPERLMNYELSCRMPLLDGRMHLGANVFYLKAENIITQIREEGRPHNVNTGRLENSGFEMEADYSPCNELRLDANYSFLHMSTPQEGAPEHKAYFGITWQKQKFAVSPSILCLAGLHTQMADENTEHAMLLNMTASYRPTRNICIFARGENLLAQKYEVVKGFPMPRATFMAGVELSL